MDKHWCASVAWWIWSVGSYWMLPTEFHEIIWFPIGVSTLNLMNSYGES